MDQKRRNRFGEEFHLQRFLHHFSRVNYEDWACTIRASLHHPSAQQSACFEKLEISEPSGQLSMKKWLPARRGERLWMATISHAAMTSAANVVSSHTLQDKNCMLNRVVMKSRYRWGPDCCTLFLLLDYAEVSARSACFQFHVDQIHFGLGYSAWSSVYPVYTKHTKCIFERS